MFHIFNFDSEFFKSFLLLHTKIPLISSFVGRRLVYILSSYLLALFYFMKKSAKVLRKPSFEPFGRHQTAFFGHRFEGKRGWLQAVLP
jgi:hypothetical protein